MPVNKMTEPRSIWNTEACVKLRPTYIKEVPVISQQAGNKKIRGDQLLLVDDDGVALLRLLELRVRLRLLLSNASLDDDAAVSSFFLLHKYLFDQKVSRHKLSPKNIKTAWKKGWLNVCGVVGSRPVTFWLSASFVEIVLIEPVINMPTARMSAKLVVMVIVEECWSLGSADGIFSFLWRDVTFGRRK